MKLLRYSPLFLCLLFNNISKGQNNNQNNEFNELKNDLKKTELYHEIAVGYNKALRGITLGYRQKRGEFKIGGFLGYSPLYSVKSVKENRFQIRGEYNEEFYMGISSGIEVGNEHPIGFSCDLGWRYLKYKIYDNKTLIYKEIISNPRFGLGIEILVEKIIKDLNRSNFGVNIGAIIKRDLKGTPYENKTTVEFKFGFKFK